MWVACCKIALVLLIYKAVCVPELQFVSRGKVSISVWLFGLLQN